MKVIFVTTYDARDIRNWSGIPYYIAKGFVERGIEVEFISELNSLSDKYWKFRLKELFYNQILNKKRGTYISFYERENLKYIAKQVKGKIDKIDHGIIFSPGTIPIAYLNTDKPIVFWTDATFAVMENYYQDFEGLSKRTVKNCHAYERNAIKRSSVAIYSSEWAATSCIKDYGANSSRVKIIPFGSNIQSNRTIKDIIENNNKKSRNTCKLLLIGQDWKRKGVDKAIRVAEQLNKSIKTELTIVGCTPPTHEILPDFIKITGFVSKSNIDGVRFIEDLYKENHFFILPTIAEAMGVVFCEANSFGLPVITTNTGGISTVIRNDINGKMFEIDFDIVECAKYIEDIFGDFERYNNYSIKSFKEYSERLNWQVSIDKCISYMKKLENNDKRKLPKNSLAQY
jgi:glycosyltransferase involved in cell wall biosynthesis